MRIVRSITKNEHGFFSLGKQTAAKNEEIEKAVICKIKIDDGYRHSFYMLQEDAEKAGLKEDFVAGVYTEKGSKEKGVYKPYKAYKPIFEKFINKVKYGVLSPSKVSLEGLNYTYGVELETSLGFIPEHIRNKYNMHCVFDGSLRDDDGNEPKGGEYVTGVLKGDAGVLQLYNICQELLKRCEVDKKCSMHVHIGGFKPSKETIIHSYLLGLMLEQEFFEMVPKSRAKSDYCKILPKIDFNTYHTKSKEAYDIMISKNYNKIFRTISYTQEAPDKNYNKSTRHPLGNKCGYKKATPRYCWLNFVPMMFNRNAGKFGLGLQNYKLDRFGDRLRDPDGNYIVIPMREEPDNSSFTLEFRNHSGTLNFSKVFYWLKISMAFVYYAENNQREIREAYEQFIRTGETPLFLSTIVNEAFPKTASTLVQYIDMRKEQFQTKRVDKDSPMPKEPGTLASLKKLV